MTPGGAIPADVRTLDAATAHLDAPFAVIDMAALRANAAAMTRRAAGKPIRLASKSVRCRSLIEHHPTLFDAYRGFTGRPAAMFALPVVRRPGHGVVTALGGGYPASGPGTASRVPSPFLPAGLRLDKDEGAGEVQTPLIGPAADRLKIGYMAAPRQSWRALRAVQ